MHAYLSLVASGGNVGHVTAGSEVVADFLVSEVAAMTDFAASPQAVAVADGTGADKISEADVSHVVLYAIVDKAHVADRSETVLAEVGVGLELGVEVRRGGASANVALVTAAVAHLVAVANALIAVQVDGIAVVAEVCAGGAAQGTGLSAT
jgi:hypothetical protein